MMTATIKTEAWPEETNSKLNTAARVHCYRRFAQYRWLSAILRLAQTHLTS
jgi:hypothetical protein